VQTHPFLLLQNASFSKMFSHAGIIKKSNEIRIMECIIGGKWILVDMIGVDKSDGSSLWAEFAHN
jgi:hypothetical protein